nr:hypothetical protein Iba_chr15cCG8450 [Ipomoea batatas]
MAVYRQTSRALGGEAKRRIERAGAIAGNPGVLSLSRKLQSSIRDNHQSSVTLYALCGNLYDEVYPHGSEFVVRCSLGFVSTDGERQRLNWEGEAAAGLGGRHGATVGDRHGYMRKAERASAARRVSYIAPRQQHPRTSRLCYETRESPLGRFGKQKVMWQSRDIVKAGLATASPDERTESGRARTVASKERRWELLRPLSPSPPCYHRRSRKPPPLAHLKPDNGKEGVGATGREHIHRPPQVRRVKSTPTCALGCSPAACSY